MFCYDSGCGIEHTKIARRQRLDSSIKYCFILDHILRGTDSQLKLHSYHVVLATDWYRGLHFAASSECSTWPLKHSRSGDTPSNPLSAGRRHRAQTSHSVDGSHTAMTSLFHFTMTGRTDPLCSMARLVQFCSKSTAIYDHAAEKRGLGH